MKTAPDRRVRAFLTLLLCSSFLGMSSCQEGGAFGMGKQALATLLAGKETAPVLALDEASLGDTGAFGPSAYYYLGRWLDSRDAPAAAERERLLYRMAWDRTSGIVKKEAGLALIGHLSSAGLWDTLLGFSQEYNTAFGAEWRAERAQIEALDALGQHTEVLSLIAHLGSAYPDESAKDADALAWFGAVADMRSGGKKWAKALRRLLLERPGSVWTSRTYDLTQADPQFRGIFSPQEFHALAMRDAVGHKDFGLAYKEALLGSAAAMGGTASPAMIADVGKAFLHSGQLKVGEGNFMARGWTARYYKARFARALEQWQTADGLFTKCVTDAPTQTDADAARWYAADCAYHADLAAAKASARDAALDRLVAASALWKDPAYFSDLVNNLFRDALRERDWRLIGKMAARLAPRLTADTAARVAYTAARAEELGLGAETAASEEGAASSAVQFATIADNRAAPLHYRALAAWRAGIEPTLFSFKETPSNVATNPPGGISETESFVAGIAGFGLADIALSEARARKADLDDEALRRLAARLSSLGRPDCALRLGLDLVGRPGYEPRRSDYELLYPRPYLDEIRSLKLESKIPERLALGLIRSESIFRADAVSWAGAIGLSQLMPATAAEQAKALGLKSYDLMAPKDNLSIGLAHFASLLGRTDGKPLHAMMAYNAGWGRLKTWVAESGNLPDDLMLEALGIEETRQYCRNILQATVMYAELYYGKSVGETVRELVEGDSAN